MSDQQPARKPVGLLVVGIALLVVGGLGALAAWNAAESQARIDEFAAAYGGRLIDVAPNYIAVWLLVIVALVGAGAVIAHVVRPLPK